MEKETGEDKRSISHGLAPHGALPNLEWEIAEGDEEGVGHGAGLCEDGD